MMETKYAIISATAPIEMRSIEWPREPGYDRLRALLEPLLCGGLEHVSVLADFDGGTNYCARDMFVHETGVIDRLPRNPVATTHYRRAAMLRMPARDPGNLPFICGTAVLFSRRVWF